MASSSAIGRVNLFMENINILVNQINVASKEESVEVKITAIAGEIIQGLGTMTVVEKVAATMIIEKKLENIERWEPSCKIGNQKNALFKVVTELNTIRDRILTSPDISSCSLPLETFKASFEHEFLETVRQELLTKYNAFGNSIITGFNQSTENRWNRELLITFNDVSTSDETRMQMIDYLSERKGIYLRIKLNLNEEANFEEVLAFVQKNGANIYTIKLSACQFDDEQCRRILEHCRNASEVFLDSLKITNETLSGLSHFQFIQKLELTNMKIHSLPDFSKCPAFRSIVFDYTVLEDLTFKFPPGFFAIFQSHSESDSTMHLYNSI